jgi:hypothetical protein
MIAAFRSSPVRSNPGFFNDNGIVAILRDSIFWIAMAISCNVHVHGICLSQVIAVNSAISCCDKVSEWQQPLQLLEGIAAQLLGQD